MIQARLWASCLVMMAAVAAVVVGCAGQPKKAVVTAPADEDIAVEVIPAAQTLAMGQKPPAMLASVANLQRDLATVLERAAPQHPMAMMARMGLRAALSSSIGSELAGAIDLSAPMVGAVTSENDGGEEPAIVVAGYLLAGAAPRLREAVGTEPMADGFDELVGDPAGQAGGEAESTLGRDFFCALGSGERPVLVCADEIGGLRDSGAAVVAALGRVRDDVALQVRFDYAQLADAADKQNALGESFSELSPLLERFQFKGKLEQGIGELRIVPDGFEVSFTSLGTLGDDLVSRLVLAPPAAGEPLPPEFAGPSDTLSVLTFRGIDFAPFKAELGELQAILEGLAETEQERDNVRRLRDLPWPGGPFVVAHGHDLAAALDTIGKELEKKRPREAILEGAAAGYLLVGVKAPQADITALVRGLEASQPAEKDKPRRLVVNARPPRGLKLPKGSLLVELHERAEEADGDEVNGGSAASKDPRTWYGVVSAAGPWTWLAFSRNQALAAARAKTMVAGKGALSEAARAALRPLGVSQASMLGYVTLGSGASVVLDRELGEDPSEALDSLREALAKPEFSQLPVPVRLVVEGAEDRRFRAEFQIKLPTSLVAAVVAKAAK